MMRFILALLAVLAAAAPAFAQPESYPDADTLLPAGLLDQFRADAAASPEADFLELDFVRVPVVVIERRDLNGDGDAEVFLSGLGRYCGASGNCPLWIYAGSPRAGWRRILASGGQGLEVLDRRTNGFRGISVPMHSSAFEQYRTEYAFDGERYRGFTTALAAFSRDDDREEATAQTMFEVRSPVPARRAGSPLAPRTVTLLAMTVDTARGVRVSAEYDGCAAPDPERCAPPRLIVSTPGLGCATLFTGDFDEVFTQAGEPVCAGPARRNSTYTLTTAQWEALYRAHSVELRSAAGTVRIGGYGRDGLAAFLASVYENEGRELPSMDG